MILWCCSAFSEMLVFAEIDAFEIIIENKLFCSDFKCVKWLIG